MVLVPAVVDIAGTTPVVAAGGIGDGRGIAAALALGAKGAQIGTRFLATSEMAVDPAWKQRIIDAHARDAVKVEHGEKVLPPFNIAQVGAPFAPRALRTPLIDALADDPESVDAESVVQRVVAAILAGDGHDDIPFTGQSTELVHDIVPAAELVGRMWQECQKALRTASAQR